MNELQEMKDTSKQREYEYTLIEPIEQASHTGEDKAPISKLILSSPTRAVMKDIFRIKKVMIQGGMGMENHINNLKENKKSSQKARAKKVDLSEMDQDLIAREMAKFLLSLSDDDDVFDYFENVFKAPGMCKLESGAPMPPQMIDALSVDDIEQMAYGYAGFFIGKSLGLT